MRTFCSVLLAWMICLSAVPAGAEDTFRWSNESERQAPPSEPDEQLFSDEPVQDEPDPFKDFGKALREMKPPPRPSEPRPKGDAPHDSILLDTLKD